MDLTPFLLFWGTSILLFALGGWQYQEYRDGKTLEDNLAWRICNTTNYKIINDFDGIVDIRTASCQWYNVSLFVCHDASDPMRCLLDNKNKFLQPSWSCVCRKNDDQCRNTPETVWPDTKYDVAKNGAIILFGIGGVMMIVSIYMTVIFCFRCKRTSKIGVISADGKQLYVERGVV